MAAEVAIAPAPANPRAWLASLTPERRVLVEKLNRADTGRLARLLERGRVLVQPAGEGAELDYSPLAKQWPSAAEVAKALAVDLTNQTFGAYENGALIRWGPISSGAKDKPTKPGLFHLNWRAARHVSTVNAEWVMPWTFNYDNRCGEAFHQYALPGFPASHTCIRLLEGDARWLYGWGVEWSLATNGRDVKTPGTPVLIFGSYDFSGMPPWLDPENWRVPVQPPEMLAR